MATVEEIIQTALNEVGVTEYPPITRHFTAKRFPELLIRGVARSFGGFLHSMSLV